MEKMSYKTFVWPQNPTVYKEELVREPQFVTEDKVTSFTGMGGLKRVISGGGAFFGEDAFLQFQKLAALFEESSAGNLQHPVWGIRYCYFTGLEMTQEARDNYVSYKFEFTGAAANGEVPV